MGVAIGDMGWADGRMWDCGGLPRTCHLYRIVMRGGGAPQEVFLLRGTEGRRIFFGTSLLLSRFGCVAWVWTFYGLGRLIAYGDAPGGRG